MLRFFDIVMKIGLSSRIEENVEINRKKTQTKPFNYLKKIVFLFLFFVFFYNLSLNNFAHPFTCIFDITIFDTTMAFFPPESIVIARFACSSVCEKNTQTMFLLH